jgi:hypothetical protein
LRALLDLLLFNYQEHTSHSPSLLITVVKFDDRRAWRIAVADAARPGIWLNLTVVNEETLTASISWASHHRHPIGDSAIGKRVMGKHDGLCRA